MSMKPLKSRNPLQIALLTAVLLASASPLNHAAAASDSAVSYKQFLNDKYAITLSDSLSKGDFVLAVNNILKAEAKDQTNVFTDLQKDSPYFKAALALHEKAFYPKESCRGPAAYPIAGHFHSVKSFRLARTRLYLSQ